jgi:hypothetical protein
MRTRPPPIAPLQQIGRPLGLFHPSETAFSVRVSSRWHLAEWGDWRIVAMRIKKRNVVGIGRRVLPLMKREPSGFRYRLAHEYAHSAVGDPRRENFLSVVYATATLFLLIV